MSESLLSRREIARKMRRSPTAVNHALLRIKAMPAFVAGRFEYYNESTISVLENAMRRKNHTARNCDV